MPTDLYPYLGTDGKSRIHTLETSWAGAGEMIQVQRTPGSGIFYHVKGHGFTNCNYEVFKVTETDIYRLYDTSPGNNELYSINNFQGEVWLPRFVDEGYVHRFDIKLDWFDKTTGQEIQKGNENFGHYLEVVAFYDQYTFPSGIVVQDVVELRSFFGENQPFERYWYAKGMGLVGWQSDTDDRVSYINNILPLHVSDLQREQIGWLGEPSAPEPDNLDDVVPEPPVIPDEEKEYGELNFTNTNFAGAPESVQEIRKNIYIATPYGWQVSYKTFEENDFAGPNVINVPGDENPGWKLEPAATKMFVTMYNENVALPKGVYKVTFDFEVVGATFNTEYQWQWGLYTVYDNSVYNHKTGLENGGWPTFNGADHSGTQRHFFFEVKENVELDAIGFAASTLFSMQNGHLLLKYFNIEQVNKYDPKLLFGHIPYKPEPEPEPEPEPQPPDDKPQWRKYNLGVDGKVNIRANHDLQSIVVVQAPDGSVIEVDENKPLVPADNYTWLRVRYNGILGWLATEVVTLNPVDANDKMFVTVSYNGSQYSGYLEKEE